MLSQEIKRQFITDLGYQNLQFTQSLTNLFDWVVFVNGSPKILIETKTTHLDKFSLSNAQAGFVHKIKPSFLLVTNTKKYNSLYKIVFQKNGNIKYEATTGDWKSILHITKIVDSIELIHKRFFDLFYPRYQLDNSFLFRLRAVNRAERLENGYFFHGNENYCAISFWDGLDTINKTPNIYIQFHQGGTLMLILTAKDDKTKVPFLSKLAAVLGAQQVKHAGENVDTWSKLYMEQDFAEDYIISTENYFLQKDKLIIDAFIKSATPSELSGLSFLEKTNFQKLLEKALSIYQNLYGSGETQPQTNTINKPQPPLKLQKISLYNIGHFSNIEIDLSAQVVCFLGENGTGKTSILRAIALGLIGVDETDFLSKKQAILQNMLRIIANPRRDGEISFSTNGKIVLEYLLDKPYQNQISFSTDASNNVEIKDIVSETSFGVVESGGKMSNLVLGFSQVRGTNKQLAKESLKDPHVNDLLPLLLDEEDYRLQHLKEWIKQLHADAKPDAHDVNKNKPFQEVLDVLFRIISEVVGRKMKLYNVIATEDIVLVQEEGKDAIPFELVSQGFKNVFGWVGYFIKRMAESHENATDFAQKTATVLIDEIDSYLHPLWQRNILNVLVKHFPNTQFVITTHSPLVVNYLETQNKTVYVVHSNKVDKKKYVYGRDIASLFLLLSNTNDRPKEITERIDLLFDLIDSDRKKDAQKLLDELFAILGKEDKDLIEAKEYLKN